MDSTPAPKLAPSVRNVVVSRRDLRGAEGRARRAGATELARYLGTMRSMLGMTQAKHAVIRVNADELAIIRR